MCLIRKRLSAGAWGIPKGTVDSGLTHTETALKEAWEEAGVRGRLVGDALGTYRYEKVGRPLTVMVYVMEVLEHHDDWDEAGHSRTQVGVARRGWRRCSSSIRRPPF